MKGSRQANTHCTAHNRPEGERTGASIDDVPTTRAKKNISFFVPKVNKKEVICGKQKYSPISKFPIFQMSIHSDAVERRIEVKGKRGTHSTRNGEKSPVCMSLGRKKGRGRRGRGGGGGDRMKTNGACAKSLFLLLLLHYTRPTDRGPYPCM